MMESNETGIPGGCLSARMSRTLLGCERPMSTSSSRPSGVPVSLLARCLRAALVFPCDINFAKDLAGLSSLTGGEFLPKRDWMVFPSLIRSESFPSDHSSILLLRALMWSLALELREGFWSRRFGITMVAFRATDSKAEAAAKVLKSLESSRTKVFPMLPWGTVKGLAANGQSLSKWS